MNVHPDDGQLFYRLYSALMYFANEEFHLLDEPVADAQAYEAMPGASRIRVRNALFAHVGLLDRFVAENPAGLSSYELEIVAGWKRGLVGKFYVFRHLAKYTIFLSSGQSPNKAYGVSGLADPIEKVIGPYLPRLVDAVLLPFKGHIIYDGLLNSYSISFGGGVKRMLNHEYNEAKKAFGIIASLPERSQAAPSTKKPPSTRERSASKSHAPSAASDVKDTLGTLIEMMDAFCERFLNEEYAELCRKLAKTLARKRPSPLLQGKVETWASGIVRTIGRINFLDDRSQKPHLKLPFIDKAFGVAESTGQGKSASIRRLLRMKQFDPQWTLPSRMEDNPMVWTLEVNGFLTDIRHAPREVQVIAYEKGMIPYIPADRVNEFEQQ